MNNFKVLFICSGCTCRSPMAMYIANQKLKNLNLFNVKVECKGLFVEIDAQISYLALQALKTLNVPVEHEIVPCEVSRFDIENSDLCFTMTKEQKYIINSKFNINVFAISEFVDVSDVLDPFGGSLEDYINTANILNIAIDKILKKLKEDYIS